jgi:flagellum-specific peptidoglycan hydrolase FlgJ
MKIILLSLFIICLSLIAIDGYFFSNVTIPDNVQEYIDKHLHIAIREAKMYNIPIAVSLSQGMLESKYGRSELSLKSNNHFGIKWKGKGKYIIYADDNPDDRFRVYDSVDESWKDHSILLTKPRYDHLRSLWRINYKSWAYGLKASGYATDPTYAQKLIAIIEKYKLWRYDLNPLNW